MLNDTQINTLIAKGAKCNEGNNRAPATENKSIVLGKGRRVARYSNETCRMRGSKNGYIVGKNSR